MTTISDATLRTLAGFRAEDAPVTSCYLDVDGRRLVTQRDLDHELDSVLRKARSRANGTESVHRDLTRIERYVKDGFDRSRVRGLAMFSCAAKDLWEVVPLPVPVRSRVVVNDQPALGQLEAIAEVQRRFGVLLVDRQRVRMFVFELDELVEHSEAEGESARGYDTRGDKERGGVEGHVEALTAQHVRRAASLAFSVFQEHGFEHLCLSGPDDLIGELEAALHPYLRERLCPGLAVTPQASLAEITEAVAVVEQATERTREEAVVGRLLDAAGAGRRAVTGLEPTLAALAENRVEHLVVADDFHQEGWRCLASGALLAVRPHREDDSTLHPVEDVVEEAIDDALAHGVKVEMVTGNADLDVHGRIGALLRY